MFARPQRPVRSLCLAAAIAAIYAALTLSPDPAPKARLLYALVTPQGVKQLTE